jgi:hypothetical protein
MSGSEQTDEQAAQAEHFLGWCDADMDAEHWFAMKNIDPVTAAMLLCRFNPNNDTQEAALLSSNDEVEDGVFRMLRDRLADVAGADSRARSLAAWLDVASELGLRHHSWASRYVRCIAAGRAGQVSNVIESAHPVATPEPAQERQTEADEKKDAGDCEPWRAGQMNESGMRTNDVLAVFSKLSVRYWDPEKMRDAFTKNRPAWLMRCRIEAGRSGNTSRQAIWRPVALAKLLAEGTAGRCSRVPVQRLTWLFNVSEELASWRDEWLDYTYEREAFEEP